MKTSCAYLVWVAPRKLLANDGLLIGKLAESSIEAGSIEALRLEMAVEGEVIVEDASGDDEAHSSTVAAAVMRVGGHYKASLDDIGLDTEYRSIAIVCALRQS